MNPWKLVALSLTLGIGVAAAAVAQPAELLADLYPDTGYPGLPSGPVNNAVFHYVTVQDKAFFWTGQGPLTVTDGTPLGTQVLPVDQVGSCNFGPLRLPLGVAGNVFFWLECIEDNGRSVIWRSDGSADGTYQLTNIYTLNVPMPLTSGDEPPEEPTYALVGGVLYFTGCLGSQTCVLWRTDGTTAGTRPVKEGETSNGAMAGLGNKLLFAGSEGFQSVLAVTDGTAAGTVHLRSFDSLRPTRLTTAGGKVFFLAGQGGDLELWVSDGTAAGTRAVSHFAATDPFAATEWLKPIGSAVYFLADDGSHGIELWRSDGTAIGTVRVTELANVSPFPEEMLPEQVAATTGGRVVFLARDEDGPFQLFASSGTPASTTPLTAGADVGRVDTTVALLPTAGGRVVFARLGGVGGDEVWSTDGTPTGTVALANSLRGKPVALLGAVYFGRPQPSPFRLWRTDGTAAGTTVFAELPFATELTFEQREMGTAGGRILFQARDRFYGLEVWAADAEGHVTVLGNLTPDTARGSFPNGLVESQGQLFFRASSPTSRSERRIWHSGGTAATTVPLAGVPPPGCSSDPLQQPFRAGDKVYFVGPGTGCVSTLWTTDGTIAGTRALMAVPFQFQWQEFLGALVFLAPGASGSTALWRSDGTPAGTVVLFDFPAEARQPVELTALGAQLYFLVGDGLGGSTAWISDGT
ncbi:MAG TPA: hypothetical protein VGS57_14125, partial [Thermoanaerobaculia bacterium]|nr:hypothetical protein [Thermoanaerobaculia bacterium]